MRNKYYCSPEEEIKEQKINIQSFGLAVTKVGYISILEGTKTTFKQNQKKRMNFRNTKKWLTMQKGSPEHH